MLSIAYVSSYIAWFCLVFPHNHIGYKVIVTVINSYRLIHIDKKLSYR